MHHVCLIRSISARKATHIKLGTFSGSSQCQLHFGIKMVSIGWMAVSGCLLNAKLHILWHFLCWLPPVYDHIIYEIPTKNTVYTPYIYMVPANLKYLYKHSAVAEMTRFLLVQERICCSPTSLPDNSTCSGLSTPIQPMIWARQFNQQFNLQWFEHANEEIVKSCKAAVETLKVCTGRSHINAPLPQCLRNYACSLDPHTRWSGCVHVCGLASYILMFKAKAQSVVIHLRFLLIGRGLTVLISILLLEQNNSH